MINLKITEVSPQKNNNLKVNVFVDGEYRFSLDGADAILRGISTGKELCEKDIANLMMDSQFAKARDKALDILSRKSITSHDLGASLAQKGYDDIVICEVIKDLESLGYIDDESYASMYFEYCLEKMWGKKKITYEMKQKGISDVIIETVLGEYEDDAALEQMTDAIKQKYMYCDLSDPKTKAKITRYFASRGFDFSQINTAINIVAKENSDE